MGYRVKKWTKGEWERVSDETLYIRTSNGERVAMLTQLKGRNGMGGRRDRGEVRANSFVIASAPALVEALEGLLEKYTDLVNCGDCGNWDPEEETAVIEARSALSLAYGETQ